MATDIPPTALEAARSSASSRDALRAVAPAELPGALLHLLQRRGSCSKRGDPIEQLAIRDQSADVVALQESRC